MSKQIQAMIDRHPEKFESWHNEDHNDRGLDYWVYCRSPYINPDSECGIIHEDTVKETLVKMRAVEEGCQDEQGVIPHYWVTSSEFDTVVRKCKYCDKKERIR